MNCIGGFGWNRLTSKCITLRIYSLMTVLYEKKKQHSVSCNIYESIPYTMYKNLFSRNAKYLYLYKLYLEAIGFLVAFPIYKTSGFQKHFGTKCAIFIKWPLTHQCIHFYHFCLTVWICVASMQIDISSHNCWSL